MTLQLDQLCLGLLQTNCYILGDSETLEAIIFDPADEAEKIVQKVAQRGYTVREIIATHAHFDHVLASQPIKQTYEVPFRLHQKEVLQLQKSRELAAMFGIPAQHPPAEHDGLIEHGDTIQVGSIQLEARFTPGHSPGHLIFISPAHKLAIVGDCIFYDGFGRVDLPGGNAATLKQSIQTEILSLPDDFTLYPGHGIKTTVGREKSESQALAYLLQF